MSIIIKGFDMPKDANVYFKVSFYGADRETEFVVSGDCRSHIIQIPKGHGRIIDESQAWSKVEKRKDGHSVITFNAPTILEVNE